MNPIQRLVIVMFATLALLTIPSAALCAQEINSTTPTHPSGVRANAPIPIDMHQKNTGGSDGAGLCVIASVKTVGEHLRWKRQVEALWEEAKRRPGGYYDAKFDELARQIAPDLKYAHYHGSDYQVLIRLSELGLPFGITMDTGQLYGGQRIYHMVTGVHFDGNLAAYIDNNSPGMFTWVSKPEWERRSRLNTGEFWVIAILPAEGWRPANQPVSMSSWLILGLAVAIAIVPFLNHRDKKNE